MYLITSKAKSISTLVLVSLSEVDIYIGSCQSCSKNERRKLGSSLSLACCSVVAFPCVVEIQNVRRGGFLATICVGTKWFDH